MTSPEVLGGTATGLDPEVLDRLRREPPPELLEAVLDDPEALREVMRELAPDELVELLKQEPTDDLAVDLLADPEGVQAAFEALDPAERRRELVREDRRAMRLAMRKAEADAQFASMQRFLCFVGYSRSGGSVVGALLDAHKNLLVAHELPVFAKSDSDEPLPELGFEDRSALMAKLVWQTKKYARRGRMGQRVREDGSRYYSSYEVEGGWQGRFETLLVGGCKNAVESSMASEKYGPGPFFALQEQVGVPICFVHVVRNPWDNITTMRRIHGERSIVRYRKRLVGVQNLKDAGFPVLDVHLDDVISDAGREVRRMCEWLEIPAEEDYVAACAAVVDQQPSRTGSAVEWSESDLRHVDAFLDEFEWLGRYRGSAPKAARKKRR